ncbi:hypothetical protein TCARB_1785 [Thermofilum adornatum 1505]|uniref:Uncharacterized protein n=1 Tax=Thermofilum adornatum 1505 TaxID=697581 RepID=A0A3G1AA72_9CREN|nr:hypothetical protein TCARB_1785 [Thermofilum adornatum 1505]
MPRGIPGFPTARSRGKLNTLVARGGLSGRGDAPVISIIVGFFISFLLLEW